MTAEIRIGMVGGVDSGKSTTLSVLINKELDDGNGKARAKVFQHKHERESGRTSCISIHYLTVPGGKFCYSLVDLAGHEKYLRTTVKGLSGYYIDYVMIMVGANMGFNPMSMEHLRLAILFRIPYIIVLTKIDICPPNILKETLEKIKETVKKITGNRNQNIMSLIHEESDFPTDLTRICPVFQISNKMGTNVELLKKYITSLVPRFTWTSEPVGVPPLLDNPPSLAPIFISYNIFLVNGIGLVLSGKMIRGTIKRGDKLMVFSRGWKEIAVRSIHDNFQANVESIHAGEAGCIAIKFKDDIRKDQLKNGLIITSKQGMHQSRDFKAEVMILSTHSTTMKVGYQPMVNCGITNQCARITEMDREVLRGGERATIKFHFLNRSEFIETGQYFVMREGRTKGLGKITEVFHTLKCSQS